MNYFIGIEMTNHQAFVLLCILAALSAVSAGAGGVMSIYCERKFRYDLAAVGCLLQMFGGFGVIAFSMLAWCFR